MKPKQDNWTLVIVGFWNRMIFMPDWVNERLFHAAELEKLVPLVPVAPLIYRDAHISLMVDGQRLVLNARKPTAECTQKMEEMGCAALRALPDTPVSALGLNFGFVEPDPQPNLLRLFDFPDNAAIGADWSIETRTIARELHKDSRILNLTLSFRQSQVHIDANFHFAVAKASDAADIIRGKSQELYTELQTLLGQAYELRTEAGD